MTDTLAFESVASLAEKIRQGAVSPVALTEELLARIDALDARLHAFIALTRQRAMGQARAAESALRGGHDVGALHGIPYAVKDLYGSPGCRRPRARAYSPITWPPRIARRSGAGRPRG